MKTTALLLFVFTSFLSFSQVWAPSGANWKYSYFNLNVSGYVDVNYIGDTIISGRSAKKFDNTLHGFDQNAMQGFVTPRSDFYLSDSAGVVYAWNTAEWDTLYNFNAGNGDSWQMSSYQTWSACDFTSSVEVIDTGHVMVNGFNLKYLHVNLHYYMNGQSFNSIQDTILERIGLRSTYMFPLDDCDGQIDAHIGGMFRCYQDDNFSLYKPVFTQDCDFVTGNVGAGELNENMEISVWPNPTAEDLNVSIQGNAVINYRIVDMKGRKMVEGLLSSNKLIDVRLLDEGIYFLNLYDQENIYRIRFLIRD